MPDNKVQSEEEVMGPREAQDRLAALFAVDEASGDGGPELTDHQEGPSTVVRLDGEEPEQGSVLPENPFAKDAALHAAMRRVEALLFASPTPLSESAIGSRVPDADIPAVLEKLSAHYQNRGVNLRQVDNKWQFVTAADVADVLVEHREQSKKLSRAALETLAIVAYHQPCTRADIEEVRGVAVAKGSLDQLLELGWLRLRGRREAPGRPVLYGTSSTFLEHFGLANIGHLPGMADLKAAGLLEARLPPGFEVPVPRSDDDEGADPVGAEAETDFTTDFHDDEGGEGDLSGAEEDISADEPGGESPFPDADDEPF